MKFPRIVSVASPSTWDPRVGTLGTYIAVLSVMGVGCVVAIMVAGVIASQETRLAVNGIAGSGALTCFAASLAFASCIWKNRSHIDI